ncbi:DUF2726 domain-containing protein [Bradyrhizobium elkanii]|uniref:DUF2726 domain-containing protein n=1 Tax=Bradyrhizobium elkanii TaxID=29448 RepID=UPI00351663ED
MDNLIFYFVLVAVFLAIAGHFLGKRRKVRYRPRYSDADRLDHGAQMLRAANSASFSTKKLMNLGEYKTFRNLERSLAGSPFRVFPQIPMDEFLQCADNDAFFAINSKRVDFLIVDNTGEPRLVVEVDGSGHWLSSDTHLRDAIKLAALSSAGISRVSVSGRGSEVEIKSLVSQHLGV